MMLLLRHQTVETARDIYLLFQNKPDLFVLHCNQAIEIKHGSLISFQLLNEHICQKISCFAHCVDATHEVQVVSLPIMPLQHTLHITWYVRTHQSVRTSRGTATRTLLSGQARNELFSGLHAFFLKDEKSIT